MSFFKVPYRKGKEVEKDLLDLFDKALNYPERQSIPAGSLLFTKGEKINGIWLLYEGKVELFQTVGDEDIIFHSVSVGRVLGLLALVRGKGAFFNCRAKTQLSFIHIKDATLDALFRENESLAQCFMEVVVRSLARRNRRSVELQIEVKTLNLSLARERDQLAKALSSLEKAQMRLVESEKMATLGQMVAGIAHELNNPVAAISRSAEFIEEDVRHLLKQISEYSDGQKTLIRLWDSHPISTRQERKYRQKLTEELEDEKLARRLVKIGIFNADDYFKLIQGLDPGQREKKLAETEQQYQLGLALANLRSAAKRIHSLVQSLRSYSRTGNEWNDNVNIHEGIDETLRLLGHMLRDVEVERIYGKLPFIYCQVSGLNQVWTNLITNAVQAMNNKGNLCIETEASRDDHIAIHVMDNGKGIAPEHLPKIFDLNFTTRQGLAEYGLGIGLPICRNIIHRHGGSISVKSEPGRTCFTVTIPIHLEETRRLELNREKSIFTEKGELP